METNTITVPDLTVNTMNSSIPIGQPGQRQPRTTEMTQIALDFKTNLEFPQKATIYTMNDDKPIKIQHNHHEFMDFALNLSKYYRAVKYDVEYIIELLNPYQNAGKFCIGWLPFMDYHWYYSQMLGGIDFPNPSSSPDCYRTFMDATDSTSCSIKIPYFEKYPFLPLLSVTTGKIARETLANFTLYIEPISSISGADSIPYTFVIRRKYNNIALSGYKYQSIID